jgi:ankyrin repeat protein
MFTEDAAEKDVEANKSLGLSLLAKLRESATPHDIASVNKKLYMSAKTNPQLFNVECSEFRLKDAPEPPLLGHLFIKDMRCEKYVIETMLNNDGIDLTSNPNSGYAPLSALISNGHFNLFCELADKGVHFDEDIANNCLVLLAKSVLNIEQKSPGDSEILGPSFKKLIEMGGDLLTVVKRKTTVLDYALKNGSSTLSDELSSLALESVVKKKLENSGPQKVISFNNIYDM